MFVFAAMWADRLIAPVGPMEGEVSRLYGTRDAAAAVDDKSPIVASALLTRVPAVGVGQARQWRTIIEEEASETNPNALDMHVLDTEIQRDHARYAQQWGRIPDDLGQYKALVEELQAEGQWGQQ